MYLAAIASMCDFTSRAKSFSNCCRSMSLSAASIRSKLSSGNFESIGTIRSPALITASTRSPPSEPRIRECSGLVALCFVLRGALAFFLRHLLGAFGALRSHGLLLLVHPFALHRAVARHVARGLLPAAEQLVEPTHRRPPCVLVSRS